MASWLEDALASIAASGESGAGMPHKTSRERDLQSLISGSAGTAPPFSLAGDPTATAEPALAALNSPIGGTVPGAGNAPFSIAGAPPSLAAAKQMTAPPSAPAPTGQPPISGAAPLGMAPGAPAGDGAEEAPVKTATDFSSRNRAAAQPMAIPMAPAAQPSIMDSIRQISPDLVALGAGLSGHGWGASQELAAGRQKQEQALALQTEQARVTSQALQKKGVPADDVAAALKSPELLKALIGQYYSKDKGVKLEKFKDADGRETAAWVDPDKQTITPASIPGQAGDGQRANVTAKLLASKGATPEEIAGAVSGGPEVMKALVGQYLGKDKFKVVQTGENDRGKKTFQLMNEQDGTFKPIPGATVAADNPSDAAAAAGITGDSFLQTVPNAQDRSLIKQLTQYDLDPGKLSARGGNRERLLALAEQYDPDFKAALYAPRAAALKEFTSGGQTSPAAIITNGNTAIQHLGRMSELADKLGGTNKGWILNGAINWANVTLEDMKNNPDLARFKGAQDRFVEEATKFYRGVGGNKSDIDRALHILTAAQSPEARQAAIQEQAELMGSKVNALQDRFKSAVGPSGWKRAMDMAGTEFPIVQQKSQEELDKIRKRVAGEKVDAVPAAKAVKPGNYVYRNGALVPE